LLFIAGIILILLEIFLPTLGIVGTIGLILVAVSIFNAVPILSEAIWIVAGAVLLTAVIVWILIRFLGWEVKWNRVVLRSSQSNEEGYTSSKDRNELLGQVGITLTPLRPSGFAKFGDRKEDVVSEGEIISRGEEVKVIHVEGMRVVVKRVKDLDSDH
jgi:membrane-bound serine protease (ClpP class)